MSKEYDEYLRDHITYVQVGFSWIEKNLPELVPIGENFGNFSVHDESKRSDSEYDAYDQYFYGGNEENKDVKEAFDIAWLHHIHENPHHWQRWVLIEDEGGASKPKALPMPYRYILEMICDWWAFSWKSGNLYEIFYWYKDHEGKMLLEAGTKKKVDDILDKIRRKLVELDKNDGELMHYGTKGMHWGERNGPPYPIGSNLKNKTTAHVEEIKDYKGKLYFISEKGVEGSKLSPRVPKNFFTENGYEDNQTPRICFAPSVDQCLMGLSQNLKEKEFIVYEPEEYPETVYKPNKGAVPDSEVTGELWVKDPVALKEVGKIFVSGDDGKDGKKFEYGEDNEAELYGWNYEWKQNTTQDIVSIKKSLSSKEKKQLNMENDDDYETTYSQAFVNYDGNKPVSYFAIDKQKDGTADVSLATNSNYQGKGYGSKAAKEGVDYIRNHLDDYKEVFWATKPDNIASQKLAEKNGFELVRDDDEWKTYSLKGKKK